MNLNSRFIALSIAFALTFLGAQAKADIVVLQQHNYIAAEVSYIGGSSDFSDSLTSWSGSVSISTTNGSATASLTSTIGSNSISIDSFTSGKPSHHNNYELYFPFATALTQLQFTVSTSRSYTLDGTLGGASPAIQLLRDGVVVLSGHFRGAFLFEVGHTYEVDGSSGSGPGEGHAGYGFTMN